jgi:multicomponent Na+:H+ antiporter subunit D
VGALLIIVPLLAVVILNLPLGRRLEKFPLGVAGLLFWLQAMAIVGLPTDVWAEPSPIADLFRTKFPVDHLAQTMFLAIGIVGMCSVLVAYYTSARKPEFSFHLGNLLLLLLAGMNGIVLVRDLFALYVFLEITAVTSFVAIVLEKTAEGLEGAFKYMILSAVATSLLLGGIALLYVVAGSTSFEAVAGVLHGPGGGGPMARAAVGMFLAGLAVKGGLVPFHGWLPDAYSAAPASVSVLLAGIVTKASGVYTLVRLVDGVFGYTEMVKVVLLAFGLLSIVVGALVALAQKDFKRMLAYSSISQVGYIILGLGAGSVLGYAGAAFHIFNHAIFKSLLFVNSAAVEKQTGTRDMDALGGISARMPITGTTSVIAMLSTAGIPPLSGFWSKLIIILAVWKAGHEGYAAAAVLASLITLAYFLSMQRRVFFGKPSAACENLREAREFALLPAVLLAAITVGLGLAAPWLFDTFLLPVGSIL